MENDLLTPNRFSNLKLSLINITSLVLDYLLQENSATQQELLKHVKQFSPDFGNDDILKAATFLYSLGRISYEAREDRICLVSHEPRKDVARA